MAEVFIFRSAGILAGCLYALNRSRIAGGDAGAISSGPLRSPGLRLPRNLLLNPRLDVFRIRIDTASESVSGSAPNPAAGAW